MGMGTLFAGIIRAPMTSVFMIFEITQDYQILVPLMVANLLSFVISRRYQPVPVYHALLHQDGVHLPSPATQTSRTARTARQVMRTDVSFIPPDMAVEEAWQWAVEHDAPVYLVGTRDRLLGAATRQQLDDWRATDKGVERLSAVVEDSLCTHIRIIPSMSSSIGWQRAGGVLPVVSRAEVHRVEGVVTPESILATRRQRDVDHGMGMPLRP